MAKYISPIDQEAKGGINNKWLKLFCANDVRWTMDELSGGRGKARLNEEDRSLLWDLVIDRVPPRRHFFSVIKPLQNWISIVVEMYWPCKNKKYTGQGKQLQSVADLAYPC